MERSSLLILRLEGPLQSWGDNAKWDTRESASMPSKSGIVGLIACAMGLTRDDPQIAALSDAIVIGVRADRPGSKIVDFQTVTGNPLRTANGGKRSSGNTIITCKTYLQDASFLVVIETSQLWYSRILAAIKSPKWCIYLGRKSCVPSRPVLECEAPDYETLLDALQHYPVADRAQYPMSFETEFPIASAASYSRPDCRKPGERNFERRTAWTGVIKEKDNVSDKN